MSRFARTLDHFGWIQSKRPASKPDPAVACGELSVGKSCGSMHFRRESDGLASRGLRNSTNFGRKSSRGAADARPGSSDGALIGNWLGFQLGGEGLELFGGQRAQERLNQDFRFAQAGGEIVV
jgi:hypothetical protein